MDFELKKKMRELFKSKDVTACTSYSSSTGEGQERPREEDMAGCNEASQPQTQAPHCAKHFLNLWVTSWSSQVMS